MNVSVIIPAYNAAKTISETIHSLQQQTNPEWEAIIIDDGSQDQTAHIANTFVQQDPRIRLISQPNKGVSAARNNGISQAKYDWLLFLDADDWVASDYLAQMTGALEANPKLDAAYCGAVCVMPDGSLVTRTNWIESERLFDTLAHNCAFTIHACVIQRALVEEVGGFDTSLHTCEDWDLWQRIARTGAQFGIVRQVMSMYRMRPGSASEDGFRMLQDGLKVIARGHGPDPRVLNPAPAFADGCTLPTLTMGTFSFVSWTAGLALGKGQDPLPMLAAIQDVHDPGLDPFYIAQAIFNAVLQATCQTPDGWLHLWPQLSHKITGLLEALEKQSQAERLASRAGNHLERLIVTKAFIDQPVTVGHTYSTSIEITQPIKDVAPPRQVERLVAHIKMEGTQLGFLELPVCDSFVPKYVLTDAIAAQFAWPILDGFFKCTIYPTLQIKAHKKGVSVWRGKTRLASSLPSQWQPSLHKTIGWDVFLQEFWGKPMWSGQRFYQKAVQEDVANTYYCDEGWLVVEAAELIPNVETSHEQIDIVVLVAGQFVGVVSVLVYQNLVPAQEIRTAVIESCGLELCRVAVREGLLGKPLTEHGALRARLQSAAILANPGQAADEVPKHMLANLLTKRTDVMALGRHPYGAIGTAVSRRATLPTQAATTLEKAAAAIKQPVRCLPQTNGQRPQIIVYLPEWGKRPLPHHANTPSNAESADQNAHLDTQNQKSTTLSRIQVLQRRSHYFRQKPNHMSRSLSLRGGKFAARRGKSEDNGPPQETEHLPILMYHRIAPTGADALARYRVTPEVFAEQLRYLSEAGYYSVSFDEWEKAAANKTPLPGKAVLITFDDGYLDFVTYAFPLLKQYGLTATVFLVADKVGQTNDWDAIYGEETPLMDWEQINLLQAQGIVFGSHTATHPHLTGLSPLEIVEEAARSQEILTQKLTAPINSFAYPYGDTDKIVQHLIGACGYVYAVTTQHRLCRFEDALTALPRIEVMGSDSLSDFAKKLHE